MRKLKYWVSKLKKREPLKKGSRVKIIGNIPHQLKKEKPPYYGTVKDIDGAYIIVKPFYKHWEAKFYRNELELAPRKKKRKSRKTKANEQPRKVKNTK